MKKSGYKKVAQFLYELGTMRKIPRMHRQNLLTDDMSDNISTHSYRVAMIGWHLAKMEDADPYKVVMMCLLHDVPEIRSSDHNWIHKRYVKVFEDEIIEDQLGALPFDDLKDIVEEYEKRTSPEAVVAKDADRLDQVLLLREYAHQGNREAEIWLFGKGKRGKKDNKHSPMAMETKSARELARSIIAEEPSSWWNELWTSTRR